MFFGEKIVDIQNGVTTLLLCTGKMRVITVDLLATQELTGAPVLRGVD